MNDEAMDMASGAEEQSNAKRETESETEETELDPWEQEVSILNVSARRFGSAGGERAWAGRTVKARRIAARWFSFQKQVRQSPA
jgi:hypothetical protein